MAVVIKLRTQVLQLALAKIRECNSLVARVLAPVIGSRLVYTHIAAVLCSPIDASQRMDFSHHACSVLIAGPTRLSGLTAEFQASILQLALTTVALMQRCMR